MQRRYKRFLVPWDRDTPDSRGFFRYAKEHYIRCAEVATEIVNGFGWDIRDFPETWCVVFNKLASPLVYLYEAWDVLDPAKKAEYDPELHKAVEEAKSLAKEVFKEAEE